MAMGGKTASREKGAAMVSPSLMASMVLNTAISTILFPDALAQISKASIKGAPLESKVPSVRENFATKRGNIEIDRIVLKLPVHSLA